MLYLCYLCRFKPLRDHLRGFLIAAWAGDKIAEFSFPEISFHFPLRPWFFFVSPAYAGKSRKNGSYGGGKKDHPRMCGEKVLYSFGLKQVSGITPAYAGKRSPALFPLRSPEDHPRVCGEKKVMRGAKDKRMGSPPHVRGKAGYWVKDAQGRGITPACAGKRKRKTGLRRQAKDHPRMCGEKRHTFVSIESGVGSPPHVRGKGPLHLLRCRVKGITPACAGKSVWSRLNRVRLADHPRMCGEKLLARKSVPGI